MIEKSNYSNGDQIIVINKHSHYHQRRFVSIKKGFLTVCSVFQSVRCLSWRGVHLIETLNSVIAEKVAGYKIGVHFIGVCLIWVSILRGSTVVRVGVLVFLVWYVQ